MDYLAGKLIDRLPRIMEDIARLDNLEDISAIEEKQKEKNSQKIGRLFK